jgi:protein-S-isoprenylcysteine O-methyltransferase Ste14
MILIVIRTRTEEDKLLTRFGDSYRTYMMQTGRFLPHVSPGGVRSWPDTKP